MPVISTSTLRCSTQTYSLCSAILFALSYYYTLIFFNSAFTDYSPSHTLTQFSRCKLRTNVTRGDLKPRDSNEANVAEHSPERNTVIKFNGYEDMIP